MKQILYGLLTVTVLAGGLAYLHGKQAASAALPKSSDSSVLAVVPATQSRANANPIGESGGELVTGRVTEVIEAGRYTYLKLDVGGNERWTAVTKTEVKQGATISVLAETSLDNFESPTLHRTFTSIQFGSIANGAVAAASASGGAACPAGSGSVAQIDHHAGCAHGGDCSSLDVGVEIKDVKRATGANSYTVAEVFGQRRKLSGSKIRVRVVVVKVTPDVLGKTYLHVRDGSKGPDAKMSDLVVATDLKPQKGEELLLEGKLGIDQDLGSGYHYDAILQDATLGK